MTPQRTPQSAKRTQQATKRAPQRSPQRSRALTKPRRRISGAQVTWGSTIVVLAVVLAFILAYNLGGSGPQKSEFGNLSPQVMYDITHVPESVFNTVGVTSPTIPLGGLYQAGTKQPPLTIDVNGKKVPYVFYWGAEFCPYCAAARWGIAIALSRFGTFSTLREMFSSATDVNPDTPTLSFYKSTYNSKYLYFKGYEVEDRNHNTLDNPPSATNALVAKYNPNGYFPFMDVDNKYFIVTSVFDPQSLHGATQASIAQGLSDPTNPVTQAIITEANILTAAICSTVKGTPASVCQSEGVRKGIAALSALPKLP